MELLPFSPNLAIVTVHSGHSGLATIAVTAVNVIPRHIHIHACITAIPRPAVVNVIIHLLRD